MNIELPENVEQKLDVVRFSENHAYFENGSFESFSYVIYATGYDFKFPFLSVDCGLSVDQKHVTPLFKHCININRPSMAIVGLPFFGVGVPMYDLQVKFCLKFMSSEGLLLTKIAMLKDTEIDEEDRKSRNLPKKKSHFLGVDRHAEYYKDLAETADIQGMKPVIPKIFNKTVARIFENFNTYRSYNYKIVDDENFEEEFSSV